jgi:diaminopimelate decarboxylase
VPDPSSATLLELLPEHSTVDEVGQLIVGGCRLTDLAAEFGTPLYVVDEVGLRDQAQRFNGGIGSRWDGSRAVFASKAFPSTAIYRVMAEEGLGVDVAGPGELFLALRAGVDSSLIVYHGNAKTSDELKMAVDAGVGLIVIDNFDDIVRLEAIVPGRQRVLLRVVPGVRGKTHDAMSTGQEGSKFGLHRAEVVRAIDMLEDAGNLELVGLHMHIGSQILDVAPFEEAVESLATFGEFPIYDLGGGLGARYVEEDHPPSVEEWLDALVGAARRSLPSEAQLLIEPGRAMVARSMVTLYTVVTVKRGAPTYVAVDGGMADNLDVSLYGQPFTATIANRLGGKEVVDLVGRHCESGDRLIADATLDAPGVGDTIVVAATGAYSFTMNNNYNGALRPPVVLVRDGKAQLVVRRERLEELAQRDV